MDFNYYYHRHQVSLMLADAAASPEARASHLGIARGYAAIIRSERAKRSVRGSGVIRTSPQV